MASWQKKPKNYQKKVYLMKKSEFKSHFQIFGKIYASLNAQQKKAVDTIEGPVMVIAGPGTGKTQVLAARIANILIKTDANPQNILALTFTESAAKNMRERVVSMIGPAGYQVRINTFHGFCNDLMLQYPEYFPIAKQATALSELEKYQIFETILTRLDFLVLKPLNRPLFYLKEVIKAISDLKREGVAPSEFKKIVSDEYQDLEDVVSVVEKRKLEKNQQKNQELSLLYQAYEEELIKQQRYDFDDMISMTLKVLSQYSDLLLELQEKLQYVLVDEYQDTNSAQNKVVNLLMSYWGQRANLFVVGDPYQSIFRFQGACLENILEFVEQYQGADIINLDTGYRCPQSIYHFAWCLMRNQERLKPLNSKFDELLIKLQKAPLKSYLLSEKRSVKILKAPSQLSEQLWIGQTIQELIKIGTQPEEIAVLARTNQELIEMAQVLERLKIKYELSAGGSILELLEIKQLINYFQLIYDLREGKPTDLMFEVMSYSWVGLPSLTVMKLARLAGLKKVSLLEYIEQLEFSKTEARSVFQLTPMEIEPIKNFLELLYRLAGLDFNSTLTGWFEAVINQSGFLTWLFNQPHKIELLIALNTLFREVKSLSLINKNAKLEDLLQVFNLLLFHNLKLPAEDLNIKKGAVGLSTVHKAKGQEWQQVFVMGLVDGRWGGSSKRQLLPLPSGLLKHAQPTQIERNDEDRRLFYVALTRASQAAYLSHPETIINNGQSKPVLQSLLLEELKDFNNSTESESLKLELVDASTQLPNLEEQLTQLVQTPPKLSDKNYSSLERAFFEQLVKNFSLSVSSLNKYLRSPQEFMIDVLLRVPKAKQPHMAFGTATHAALEKFYQQFLSEKSKPNLKFLLENFQQSLSQELLTPEDFKRRWEKGKEVLTHYYHEVDVNIPSIIELETFFGFGQHPTYFEDIHLTGRVDRIDWLDQKKGLVKVIDYKTGKVKSHNAIVGVSETKDYSPRELALPEPIRGYYKRQLLFYKLLADLSPGFEHQVTTGEFEFIEPNPTGKIVKHAFDLPKEEVELLKKLIKEVMAEIRGLAFLE